ncbi:MAG: hypothetical protein M3322_08100 [Actinomycetota bacterium]|nr:hypothetical protein [Actinomycetota bacterium]
MPARLLALLLVATAVAPVAMHAATGAAPNDGRAVSRFVESVRGKRTLVVAFHPF